MAVERRDGDRAGLVARHMASVAMASSAMVGKRS
jgi:hypothetical protein